jgi:sec-independent protein translocase protein TatB
VFLFIFESIGTSELLLVGVVALIFLGPRKLPEMARKIGKIMAEFRSTTNEFKETWQREVNFEEEARSLNLNDLDAEVVTREIPESIGPDGGPAAPAIKAVDPSRFENLPADEAAVTNAEAQSPAADLNDKANWL